MSEEPTDIVNDIGKLREALRLHAEAPDLSPTADVQSYTLPWWTWDAIVEHLSSTPEGEKLAQILYPANNEALSDVAHIIDPDLDMELRGCRYLGLPTD